MANVNVSYQEMEAQASKLQSGKEEIESNLTAMQRQVEGLVSGGFVTDAASASFQASFDEFKAGMSKAIEGLTEMSTYLNNAANTFRDVDAQLARAARS